MGKFKVRSNIVNKDSLRVVQTATLKVLADTLTKSFGPNGVNTAYRKEKDIARYTKDGHTILQEIMFTGPIEFTMKQNLVDITRRIVTTVGDGTTSAVILAYEIFKNLCDASKKFNISDKQLIADFNTAVNEAIEIIESNRIETTVEDIYKIAMISTDNNEYIANLITDIYKQYGMDVFIDVGVSGGTETMTREHDGFTIPSGYGDVALINNTEKHTCEIRNPEIYIFEDPIDTIEISAYMEKVIYDNITEPASKREFDKVVPTIIVCPRIGTDVISVIDDFVKGMAQMPPAKRVMYPLNIITNISKTDYLMDLAYLSGAKLIRKYIDPALLKADQERGLAPTIENIHNFCGHAEAVISTSNNTKFINPVLMHNEDGTLSDLYNSRLEDMKDKLASLEETRENIVEIATLKRRINAFKSNLVEIFVGGISLTDRDALRDLVEDAVLNCRSAAINGYGRGANFEGYAAFDELLCDSDDNEEYNIYQIIVDAYENLYAPLYFNKEKADDEVIRLIEDMFNHEMPMNIRTKQYDNTVLSSIKSDSNILEAINKIMGTVFLTNQFLVADVQYNSYTDITEEE